MFDLLNGVQLNLLDSKMIALGYVRKDLAKHLCTRATKQLVQEGIQRSVYLEFVYSSI